MESDLQLPKSLVNSEEVEGGVLKKELIVNKEKGPFYNI